MVSLATINFAVALFVLLIKKKKKNTQQAHNVA